MGILSRLRRAPFAAQSTPAQRAAQALAVLTVADVQSRIGNATVLFNNARPQWFDIPGVAFRDGTLPANVLQYIADFTTLYDGGTDENIEMFCLVPLARFLIQNGNLLSAPQRANVLAGIANPNPHYILAAGTVNHQSMRHGGWYLLAQIFPDAQWKHLTDAPRTSAEIMSLHKGYLSARRNGFLVYGNYEALSTTYSTVNLFPALALTQFAQDAEVRGYAQTEVDSTLAMLAEMSFHGRTVAPITRRNTAQLNTAFSGQAEKPIATVQHLLWLYFGEPDQFSPPSFRGGSEPPYVAEFSMAELQGFGPSAIVRTLGGSRPRRVYGRTGMFTTFGQPETYYGRPERDTRWEHSAYIEDAFAIGVAWAYLFSPYWLNNTEQNFSLYWKGVKKQNCVECVHPYWKADSGVNAWGTDMWSPFLQHHLLSNTEVISVADIPTADPWQSPPTTTVGASQSAAWYAERDGTAAALHQVIQFRAPRDCDEIVVDGQNIFIRDGTAAYVAICVLNGTPTEEQAGQTHTREWRVWKVPGPKTAIYWRVGRQADFPNFAAFRAAAVAARPAYNTVSGIVTAGTVTVKHQLSAVTGSGVNNPPGFVFHRAIPLVTGAPAPGSAANEAFAFQTDRVQIGGGQFVVDGQVLATAT